MVMKIIASILILLVTLPICLSLANSSAVDLKDLIPIRDRAIVHLVTYRLDSEPAMMFLLGAGLIGIAGLGKKISLKNDHHQNIEKKSKLTRLPYPDPVPWKKEN